MEGKILCLHGRGMGCTGIRGGAGEMHGLRVPAPAIGPVTDKIIDGAHQWRRRPIDVRYPIVWLDAIHHEAMEDHEHGGKAACTVPGANPDGMKEVLGIHSAKTRGDFNGDNAPLKLSCLAIKNAEKKWTMPIKNWGMILSQLGILFKDQMSGILDS